MRANPLRLSPLLAMALAAPLSAAPIISTATFQQGTAGYADSFDRKIGPAGAGDVNGSTVNTDTTSYFIDGGTSALNDAGARQGLLRFNNITGGSGVPSGAKVITRDGRHDHRHGDGRTIGRCLQSVPTQHGIRWLPPPGTLRSAVTVSPEM